jgi:hypothetical protein
VSRIFLLSPAHCGGQRAALVLNERARFDLARRVRAGSGAPLGEVFSFLSGLYFRGKLAYARAFARPPSGLPGVYVITPTDGLELPDTAVDLDRLRRFAKVDIHANDERYRRPLLRHAELLARAAGPRCEVVLLGSIATGKYILPLREAFGPRLYFPAEFVGRGDMSRGSLLLRHARAQIELGYTVVPSAEPSSRRGRRARSASSFLPGRRDSPS